MTVQRVVIVGRDAEGWMAALALQRAFGSRGVQVFMLEVPSRLQACDVYTALPSLAALHRLLGFDERILVRTCAAVPRVAQRFSNWSRSRPPFIHGYDQADEAGSLPFLQYWRKATRHGLRVALEDFSPAVAAAKQGRVPLPGSEGQAAGASAGWQMDARSYAGLLKHLSLKAGVEHRTGRVADVSQDGHRISSIVLDGGETFEGDLYIDASGLESILAARNGGEFEGWERWLPSDRILSASGPQLRPVPAFAQVTAFKGGWIGLHPLQDRTAIVGAISADAAAELRDDLSVIAGIPIEGDALLSDFRPGMRPRPWTGNCVAIGQAAVSLEPLGSMQLHIAHAGISHLISLFPAGDGGFPPAAQYNLAVGGHARSLRDFQIAHYRLNKRFDEPLWDRARDAEGPETLTSRLDAFRERGDIPFFEGDTFTGSDWSSILVGHGLEPAGSDPRIEALREQELMAMIQARLQKVAADVRAMPPIEEFIQAAGSRSQPGV